ncbi:MAG: hypothetical protein FH748_01710 [Balneolaceae bacterium]|nr:hypothetical protein [Balneolaceae bacterium]
MRQLTEHKIIGRAERVNLPEWGFTDLEAKIDTGAYTSSLHCHRLEEFIKDNERWIQFSILDPEHRSFEKHPLQSKILDKREVKSSNGHIENRFFVQTSITLFGKECSIEFSLTDRSSMKYPLLIGRKFIKKAGLLVDVSQKNLSSKFLIEKNN